MKVYLVGGAVRDKLLKRESSDKDYVVVNSSIAEMLSLGYKQVGKGFPVFLHPETRDEYALARVEKSTGKSHSEFQFKVSKVSLDDDLKRRDLTINALALVDGQVYPKERLADINNKILRHVSKHFSEDPLRVLRVARFAAQLPEFTVAKETIEIMTKMVDDKLLESLTGERIFRELSKALVTEKPSLFFNVLDSCNALPVVFPELYKLKGKTQPVAHHPEGDAYKHTMICIDSCTHDLAIKLSVLVHDFGKGLTNVQDLPHHYGHESSGVPLVEAFCKRLRVPKKITRLCLSVTEHHIHSHLSLDMKPQKILKLLKSIGSINDRKKLLPFLLACECDNLGKLKDNYIQKDFLIDVLDCINQIKTSKMVDIPQELHKKRLSTIKQIRKKYEPKV